MTFTPRLTDAGMQGSQWWYSSGNPFYPTYGLPNCTCYAYGRYAEARGAFAPLPTGNAGLWYNSATGFQRGSTPRLGAVICYNPGPSSTDVGHVAIVEVINSDGSIVISESAYGGTYFWTETVYPANGYLSSWMVNYGYYCAGFIYNDIAPGPTGHRFVYRIGGTGTSLTQAERENNILAIWDVLGGKYGWTAQAVAGACGCFLYESGYNPGIYETSHGGTLNNLPYFPGGMGLAQWTDYPAYAGTYPNPLPWCADYDNRNWYDGEYQCELMTKCTDPTYTGMGYGQGPRWGWLTSSAYPSISFSNYTTFAGSAADACRYWFYDFEWHSATIAPWVDLPGRIAEAERVYAIISGVTPVPPGPGPGPIGGVPWGGIRDVLRRLIIHA